MKYSQVFKPKRQVKERRPAFVGKEEEMMYHFRLRTIEHRTLLNTIKENLTQDQYEKLLVDYHLRVRKAKDNYKMKNWVEETMSLDHFNGGGDNE